MPITIIAIRKLVQPLVREMVRQGFSGVKVLDILRGQGLGYRMTDFYKDMRRFRGALAIKKPILATSLRHRFKRELFQPARIIVRKYEYVVNVFTKNRVTGEVRKREAIIDDNLLRTRNYVEERARWYIQEQSPKIDEDVIGAEIDSMYYNPDKVWGI